MADKKDSQLPNITSLTGVEVAVLTPDGGSPTGFENAKMSNAAFKADLQAQITANTNNVAAHTTQIAALQNASTKRLDSSVSATFDFQQDADTVIREIYLSNVSGSPTVKIGTSVGGDDIVGEIGITSFYCEDIIEYTDTNRTIYVTITGVGTVDIAWFSKKSLFN